jgi:hypothetical protein
MNKKLDIISLTYQRPALFSKKQYIKAAMCSSCSLSNRNKPTAPSYQFKAGHEPYGRNFVIPLKREKTQMFKCSSEY